MLAFLYHVIITPIEVLVELIFSLFYDVFSNPGISIVAVSLVINFLVMPLYKRSDAMQEEEREKQKKMKPWLDHIKRTFKGDERFMMTQAYYKEQHYKPLYVLKSSVSLLLQVPFFMAAYNYLSNLGLLNGSSFLFLTDLGKQDGLISVFGLSINLMPILMTGINILSGMIYTKGFSVKEKLQLYGMALVFLVLLYTSPSGLVLYWTINNLFSLLKNVFLKALKGNKTVFGILSALFGTGLFAYIYFIGYMTWKRFLFFGVILLICFIPLGVFFFQKIYQNRKSPIQTILEKIPDVRSSFFFLCMIGLAILLGFVIPSSVVSASAIEFATNNHSPSYYVVYTAEVYFGLFVLWVGVFYLLGQNNFRKVITYLSFAILCVGIVDFFLFSVDNGVMSAILKFDTIQSYDKKRILLNLGVIGFVFLCAVFLSIKKESIAKKLLVVFTIGLICMTISNFVTISKNLAENSYVKKENEDTEKLLSEKKFTFSKNGQNVVVLMLDRAMSIYVEDIMKERPELLETFSGFTYYPNTVSFGGHTNLAAPAMFGGYEYTPNKINERSDESLKDKHNEALKVLPTIFSREGYDVRAYDIPYLNYIETSDTSVLNNIDGVYAENLVGRYYGAFLDDVFASSTEQVMEWNFLMYSLFRSVPLAFQMAIYHNGDYYSTKSVTFTNGDYLLHYSTLLAMPYITEVEDTDNNYYVEIQNSAPHSPALLPSDTYEPDLYAVIDPGANESDSSHYDVNMATYLKLANWFKYLKEQGVWDNTKIILVSDHGYDTGADPELYAMEGFTISMYNPVLMVKDFNAEGSMQTDETFMTNADVPSLTLQGLVENPVNPYTGNPINMDGKEDEDYLVSVSHFWEIEDNNGNTFEDDAPWYYVSKDVRKRENWVKQ